VKKIFDNTEAQHDQEHLDVLLVNSPRLIDDRTAYILAVRDGKIASDPATDPANPGRGIVTCIESSPRRGPRWSVCPAIRRMPHSSLM
jgi:hypothetical protein